MGFLKSTAIVSFFTLLSRIFGFIRDVFFAKYLGAGLLSDVFLTSFKLPNFFRDIFAEGAFNATFVPIFSTQIVNSDKESVIKFSRNIFSLLLYSLLIITLIFEIFMPKVITLIAAGFTSDPYKFKLTVTLSRIMFPYLIFISLVSFMCGILNSYGKFAVASVNPIILNIIFIIASILSVYINKNIAFVLSYAVLIGGLIQLLWLLFFTVKKGIILYPVYPKLDDITKKFLSNFSSGLISCSIVQINSLVDSIIAAKIPNAISYLYYAERLVQLPISLIGVALSTAIMPLLSKKIEKRDSDTNEIQENTILFALFLGFPCAIGLSMLSYSIISVLFERGEFDAIASENVSRCLKIYSLAIPSFIVSKILQTIFYSSKDTKTPMVTSFISLITNIVFNIVFVRYYGFIGIIMSSIISSYVNLIVLLYFLIKRKKLKFTTRFYLSLAKIVYVCIFMAMTLLICDKYIQFKTFFKLFLSIFIASSIYLGISYKIKVVDFREFL